MSERAEFVRALREMLAASGVMHAYIGDEIPADRQPEAARLAAQARVTQERRIFGGRRNGGKTQALRLADLSFGVEAPDLCPKCGAYWRCDCGVDPEELMGDEG